ncbi:type II secretion system F family protein [Actinomyces bowdenii]|uniref:Type II secretion system F family protein n=1 Tax=Actinomyces bowdenii TaxID=131109 RepID=A0A3P1UWX0_9ACTO|nr:type II secretion system F family protein [Actinomyces bowdenii]MBO3724864.1 type II secretion system F family protein [Actinomyces bowdenii]RRD26118.1 type II secretion system F family protein [Actinomyces bowdenii]
MSPTIIGGLAGLLGAAGLLLVLSALRRRRPTLMARLAPYVHQRPAGSGLLAAADAEGRSIADLLLAAVTALGGVLDSLGSSASSVRARLARSGSSLTLEQFRLQQLEWAAAGFLIAVGLGALAALTGSTRVPAFLLLALLACVCGAAMRDWRLSQAVRARRDRIEAQLPDVVELLALAVGAGQGPVAAMERVVALGRGDLVAELAATLTDIRSGTVLTTALDHLEARAGSLHVTRLCEAISVALERGTPLAEVLRSQAADVREAARRDLMEEGGRREIAQMVPVVFLVLPITVAFALFPGLFVLRLGL